MQKSLPNHSIVLGVRAAVAAIGGLYITFSQAKGWHQTLLVLALFCVAQVAIVALAFLLERDRNELLSRLPLATVALAVAVLASIGNTNEPPIYEKVHWLLVIWGLISGAFGLWQARRQGAKFSLASENYLSAILALLFALVLLVYPEIDIITTEGFLGAYLIIDAVNLAIAATTPEPKRG